jgi:hypothetical protein
MGINIMKLTSNFQGCTKGRSRVERQVTSVIFHSGFVSEEEARMFIYSAYLTSPTKKSLT